ncbi:Dipeptidyl aminopeptidase/acylaminoacyl peptidase [Duganella sp. CF458]|nr:Dipeptidyl aminopeptidase/acylaminoacyl peptidase [Duganella sp. CF458]
MRSFLLPFLLQFHFASIAQAAPPLSVDDATAPGSMVKMVISPDTKHIAAIVFNGTNYGLGLLDSETLKSRLIYDGTNATWGSGTYVRAPRNVEWAGNDLLTVDLGLDVASLSLDGKVVATFAESLIGPAERANSGSVMKLVYTDGTDGDIALANARTGELQKFSYPSGKPLCWAFDKSGQLRAVTLMNSAFWKDVTKVSNWYRTSADAKWQKLAEFGVNDDFWTPIYVPDDSGKLVVRSRAGRDTYAMFEYDIEARALGSVMVGHPTLDIIHADGVSGGVDAIDRVFTHGMKPQVVWFDPAWARLQASVDQAFPGMVNSLSGDPTKRVLVHSYSDVDPGAWYLLDIASMQLRTVAVADPLIRPEEMRPMSVIQYKALDGLAIPAYLTRPDKTEGPQPTVVMIHGGPVSRDSWRWNIDVQLLASRGYVVFQPQFRGSSGFGKKFEQAGVGQWGLAMQDDVTAGVQYLIREGIADPKRICIYGASYGGYAALWGLAKTPELYRCGISFAGVSDLEHMWNDDSDTSESKVGREYMTSRIGDVRTQRAKFAEVSPLKNAEKIKAAVLLIHGRKDRRVPISHSYQMWTELDRLGNKPEWLYFEEGHSIFSVRNLRDYYHKILDFLQLHIGGLPAVVEPKAGAKAK